MPTREEVFEIARMAGLTFTPAEIDRLHVELLGILDHIDVLRQLTARAGHVGDSARHFEAPLSPAPPLRPDVPGADPLCIPPSAIAPAWRDGFFTLPRVSAADGPG